MIDQNSHFEAMSSYRVISRHCHSFPAAIDLHSYFRWSPGFPQLQSQSSRHWGAQIRAFWDSGMAVVLELPAFQLQL